MNRPILFKAASRLLFEHGCERGVKDAVGHTPLDLAKFKTNSDIAMLLVEQE